MNPLRVVAAAALTGAAAGVACVLVAEASVRRGRRVVAELTDLWRGEGL